MKHLKTFEEISQSMSLRSLGSKSIEDIPRYGVVVVPNNRAVDSLLKGEWEKKVIPGNYEWSGPSVVIKPNLDILNDLRESGKDLGSPDGHSDERLMDDIAEFVDNAIELEGKIEVYFDADINKLIFQFNKDFNLDELDIEQDMKAKLNNLT